MDRDSYVIKMSVVLTVCLMGALFVLVLIGDIVHLSDTFVKFAVIGILGIGIAVPIIFGRRARRIPLSDDMSSSDRKWIRYQIRFLKLGVAMFAVGLIAVISDIRSDGILATAIPVVINLPLIWWMIRTIKRLRNRLNNIAIDAR